MGRNPCIYRELFLSRYTLYLFDFFREEEGFIEEYLDILIEFAGYYVFQLVFSSRYNKDCFLYSRGTKKYSQSGESGKT